MTSVVKVDHNFIFLILFVSLENKTVVHFMPNWSIFDDLMSQLFVPFIYLSFLV